MNGDDNRSILNILSRNNELLTRLNIVRMNYYSTEHVILEEKNSRGLQEFLVVSCVEHFHFKFSLKFAL